MENIKKILFYLDGKKTYLVAGVAIGAGIYFKNTELIVTGLGLAGMRRGLSTEIAKVVAAQDIEAEAKRKAIKLLNEFIADLNTEKKAKLNQPMEKDSKME
jgi:hypothetical protein